MASKSRIQGTLKRTERPSTKPVTGFSISPRTPDHYGPYPRQTMQPRQEAFLSSSSESSPSPPQVHSIPQNGSFLAIIPPRSASSTTSGNLSSTNYELDYDDQLKSFTNQMTQLPPQNSDRAIPPWVLLASRKIHAPKKSMSSDFELITRLAALRRQTDGTSSTSSLQSLTLLGSSVSITSSAFSQSFCGLSSTSVVEFPPTPVFMDVIPAGLVRKLEPLSVRQAANPPASKNWHLRPFFFFCLVLSPLLIFYSSLYLKGNVTEVPGTFSVSGSNRRMHDLQAAFESHSSDDKSLDGKKESYTTHDIASVFQRFLTQMPEPVIPHDMYHLFRDALTKEPFNQEQVIAAYISLIRRMPRVNQYLFLYLLMVFPSECDTNLMTVTNLTAIFCPGFILQPQHETLFKEHALNQKVLEFLIPQQD